MCALTFVLTYDKKVYVLVAEHPPSWNRDCLAWKTWIQTQIQRRASWNGSLLMLVVVPLSQSSEHKYARVHMFIISIIWCGEWMSVPDTANIYSNYDQFPGPSEQRRIYGINMIFVVHANFVFAQLYGDIPTKHISTQRNHKENRFQARFVVLNTSPF